MKHQIRSSAAYFAAALAVCLLLREVAPAYSSGPPDGVTGAPGESTCGVIGCHGNLNVGNGLVSLTTSADYQPGDTLDVLVNLKMLGQQRWGFETTVLDSLDQPVGEILRTDSSRTQLSVAPTGRQYIKQTTLGTDAGVSDQAPGWAFRWIAPSTSAGTVTFYVAGNAADNSGTNLGDYIYTSSTTVAASVATSAGDNPPTALPAAVKLQPNYPNPFNPSTTIAYTLPRGAVVTLTIYNVLGRAVRTLESGYRGAGDHIVRWDGRDGEGESVASGIYFYRLVTGGLTKTRKMILAK